MVTRSTENSSQFQFTHPCGCDSANHYKVPPPICFNSRTRVGATLRILPSWEGTTSFNSRTRVGATPYLFQLSAKHDVSIHAPVWVRLSRTCGPTQSNWFQFTHPCGCDRPNSEQCVPLSGFQFTHPCGCDRRRGYFRGFYEVSIHAPVWVRLTVAFPLDFIGPFQFTHPCGCDC